MSKWMRDMRLDEEVEVPAVKHVIKDLDKDDDDELMLDDDLVLDDDDNDSDKD